MTERGERGTREGDGGRREGPSPIYQGDTDRLGTDCLLARFRVCGRGRVVPTPGPSDATMGNSGLASPLDSVNLVGIVPAA